LQRISDAKIIRKFKSRQNIVYLAKEDTVKGEKLFVYKYHQADSADKEVKILNELYAKKVRVPRIIRSEENLIVLEYIAGDTLLERIEYLEANKMSAEKEIMWAVDFFETFYRAFKNKIIFDINFCNFLICDQKIWGVDFEDVRDGIIETDMGRFIAFLLTYQPLYTDWKLDLMTRFFTVVEERFVIDKHKIQRVITDEFSMMEKRRGLKVPETFINKISF